MRLNTGKKTDNRGMSLIELLCAVAIFTIVVSMVSGVFVVSTHLYNSGVSEVSLQQEAQYLTNQIGNLIKDANQVVYGTESSVTGYFISTTDTEGYLLEYNSTDHIINYYTYTTDESNTRILSAPALLAEHVDTFTMNSTDFDSTRAVRLTLKMDNGSRNYDMDYTMTARNEVVQKIEFSEIPEVTIECENLIYLVPGETWDLPVMITGETGGIDIECPDGVSVPKNHYEQNEPITNLPISLDNNVTDATKTVIIKTSKTVSEESLAPVKSVIITINVRRVNTIQVKSVVDVTGTANNTYEEAGSIFTFFSEADIHNPTRKVGKAWDNDWKQPAAVEWSAELTINNTDVSVNEYFEKLEEETDIPTPMVKYRLKRNMPAGMEFSVKSVSIHRRGYNKNNAFYCDLAGENKDIYGVNTIKPRETKISGTAYMVLEPNQTGSVTPSVSMIGGETTNIQCELIGTTDVNTTVSYADGQVTVKLGTDEMGITQSYIDKNGNTLNGNGLIKAVLYAGDREYADAANKTDTACVYIFVRRVTGLDLNYYIMSGDDYPVVTPFKKDATYQFRTRVDGTNLETLWFEDNYVEGQEADEKIKMAEYARRFGIEFTWKMKQKDKEPSMEGSVYWISDNQNTNHLPYKKNNGTKADFLKGECQNDNLYVQALGYNQNGPCINVKLLTDYPQNTEFEVTATILHTKGTYSFHSGSILKTNQTGVQYATDITRTVSLNNVIEFEQGCIVADPTQGQDCESGDTRHMLRVPIEVKTRINRLVPLIEGNQKQGTRIFGKMTQSCPEGGTGYVYIAIDKDEPESNDLKLIVKAIAVDDAVGDNPLAEIEIPIHIRRVTDVTVEKLSGENSAGDTLQFEATAGGINDMQYFQPHRNEDGTELYPWDTRGADGTDYIGYVTPYAWQWSISFDEGETWHDFVENEKNELVLDVNDAELVRYIKEVKSSGIKQEKESPMSSVSLVTESQRTIAITLNENLPPDSQMRAVSRHAAGENRGGKMYEEIYGICTIPKAKLIDPDDPVDDGEWGYDNGLLRGNNYTLKGNNSHELKAVQKTKWRDSGYRHWFLRWREITGVDSEGNRIYGEWTQYYASWENSVTQMQLNANETRMLMPDKRYEYEVALMVVNRDKKKVYWPVDDSIFEDGTGFKEEGYKKGWSSSDKPTPKEDYSSTYLFGRACVKYEESDDYQLTNNDTCIGSADNPKCITRGSSLVIHFAKEGYSFLYEHYQDHCIGRAQKMTNSGWVSVDTSLFGSTWGSQKYGVGLSPKITVSNELEPGLYRLSVKVVYKDKSDWYVHGDGIWSQEYEAYKSNEYILCGSNGKVGYIYLKVE